MGHNGRHRRTSDPLTMLAQGLRRMSALRLEDVTRSFENFANPSARGLLESMGRTRQQQIATMVEMLRNSTEADIEEMGQVFGEAMARLAEERIEADGGRPSGDGSGRARDRHDMSAAEWRRQRRRAL